MCKAFLVFSIKSIRKLNWICIINFFLSDVLSSCVVQKTLCLELPPFPFPGAYNVDNITFLKLSLIYWMRLKKLKKSSDKNTSTNICIFMLINFQSINVIVLLNICLFACLMKETFASIVNE